jgi:hypothetical protein
MKQQMSWKEALARVRAARLGDTYYDQRLREAIEIVTKNPQMQPAEDEKPALRERRQ